MQLVEEVYYKLKEKNAAWPEYAVVVVKDADGEIKFSSVGKSDIGIHPSTSGGIYNRGSFCLFNSGIVDDIRIGHGAPNNPEVVTRSEYESYYYTQQEK